MTKTKKKAPRRHNFLLLLVIALLVIIVSAEVVKVYWKLDRARDQEALLSQQEQQLLEENQELREDLEKRDDEDFIKALARELGWYEDGSRLFVDPNR